VGDIVSPARRLKGVLLKRDIDRLMAERNLDWIVVEGPDGFAGANPDYSYLTNGEQLTGTVLKQRGDPAMIVYRTMERQQAESTGLVMIPRDRWNMREIRKQCPDNFAAEVEHRRRMFSDLGISGRVGIYGTVKAGPHFAVTMALGQRMPGLEFVAEFENDLFAAARLTKDAEEVERMRAVGRKTCAVVQAVVDRIRAGHADGDTLVDASGQPITIGHIRQLIGREIAAQGLETPQGTIFAQGRDAGMPHAHGDDAAPLKLGQAIVFDIYPREAGGGYYHDMTRTFAIGYAPPELQQLYDDVLGAFRQVVGELEVGAPTKPYQDMVCQFFEARGHATIGSTFPIEEGYVHGLGHGLGLEIHEDFGFPAQQDRGEVIVPGAVFSIEPGLYYPSKGYGVRIEDTIYCTPEGEFESLTTFPKELVIPIGEA
jgi:Xaa-Pro aminopeptidase